MPLDPVLIEDTRKWLLKAVEDLEISSVLIGQELPLVAGAAFHAQQAAEKILKGFLTWHDEPFKKNHDLSEIGQVCKQIDNSFGTAIDRVSSITPWAIESRYPGDWQLPSPARIIEAINDVRELLREVLSRLPAETHP
jgi:HEPN domain-containing protein